MMGGNSSGFYDFRTSPYFQEDYYFDFAEWPCGPWGQLFDTWRNRRLTCVGANVTVLVTCGPLEIWGYVFGPSFCYVVIRGSY